MARRSKAETLPRARKRSLDPALKRRNPLVRIFYTIVVLAACCLVPLFVNTVIGYVPLLLVVLLILLSFIYLQLLVPALHISERANHYEWMRGETGEVTITLSNSSPLLFLRLEPVCVVSDIEGQDESFIRMRTLLGAHEQRDLPIEVLFDHVGLYQMGLCRIEIFDLLGLFSKVVDYDGRCTVRVVPVVHDLESIGVHETSQAENVRNTKSVLSDDMDYAYVREYEIGDPMKKVHWKLSSRNGGEQLYTKLFETHNNPGITVFLDFYSTESDVERRLEMFDTLLEASFSVLNFAKLHSIDTQLVFRDLNGDIKTTEKNAPEELDPLIDDMPRLSDAGEERDTEMMITAQMQKPNMQPNVFFFTSEFSQANVTALTNLKRTKRTVKVFAVLPSGLPDHERNARTRPFTELASFDVKVIELQAGEDIWKAGAR